MRVSEFSYGDRLKNNRAKDKTVENLQQGEKAEKEMAKKKKKYRH